MPAEQLTIGSRRCSKCRVERPLTEFHRRGNDYQWWCKPCRRTHDAAYHAGRKELRIKQKNDRRLRLTEWMREVKSVPCADCGGTFHPAAMQFDHLPGTTKVGEVAELVRRGCVRLARAEILKCDVVCANCHAIRTFSRWEETRRARKTSGVSESIAVYLFAA